MVDPLAPRVSHIKLSPPMCWWRIWRRGSKPCTSTAGAPYANFTCRRLGSMLTSMGMAYWIMCR